MATEQAGQTEVRPVRFARRGSRGVLLGLSRLRLGVLGAAMTVFTVAIFLAGATGVVFTGPIWVLLAGSTLLPVAGRPLVEWVPVATHWAWRRTARQNVYGVRVHRPRPAGTLALPGDAAALRLHTDVDTGAAMVHDPHAATLTAVLRVTHPAFVLLGPGEQGRRVDGWGRALATFCQSGRISRIQVLERTLPDSGSGVAAWWQANGVHDGSWSAACYDDLVAGAAPTAERHETTISVSLDLRRAGRAIRHEGGGLRGAAAVLRQDMRTVEAALRSAELGLTGWLDPDALAVVLRTAYDPAARPNLDHHQVGRDLASAGPVGVEEHWGYLRTDSGFHAVLWLAEWPRAYTHPAFLSPLLLSSGTRRALSIVAQPVTTAQALRDVRRERVEYQTDVAHREKVGQIVDYALQQEWADVLSREQELVAGHGDLRYTGLVAVTAESLDGLHAARANLEQAAIQSGCELRLLVGQQAQAFAAAALPLGRGI